MWIIKERVNNSTLYFALFLVILGLSISQINFLNNIFFGYIIAGILLFAFYEWEEKEDYQEYY